MISIFNRYFINYFIWWYLVQSKIFFAKVTGFWVFVLNFLNVLPMLQHLFTPLYQDYTKLGRIIAFPIRLFWVVVGTFIQLLLIPPILLVMVIYLVLPFLPIYGIISYLANG